MAISKVQGPTIVNGDDDFIASFVSTPTEGNLLIVCVATTGSTGGFAAAASVVGYTKAITAIEGSTGGNGIWYKIAGASESRDVNILCTGSTSTYAILMEWTGLTTPTLDKTKNTDDTGGTVTSRSSGTTETTTANEELAIALVNYGNTTTAQSWSNSFTDESSNDLYIIAVGSKILSATAAIETTLSWTTARRAGGCIATFKAGGGTGYTQAVAGTLTPAGAPVRQTSKPLAGQLTSTGAILLVIHKILAGTLTPTGALATIKAAMIALGGTLNMAGAVVRRTGKTLSGVLTPEGMGDWAKAVFKPLGGTLTGAGVASKRTTKAISGTLTSSGVVAAIKTALIALGGTLTMAGTVAKRTGKALAGTLTGSGTISRAIGKAVSGTLTTAGTLIKSARKIFAGALTSAGGLVTQFIGGGILYFKTVAGTLTSSGVISRAINKAVDGTLTSAGTVIKRIAKSMAGVMTSAGGLVAALLGLLTPGRVTPSNIRVGAVTSSNALVGAASPSDAGIGAVSAGDTDNG